MTYYTLMDSPLDSLLLLSDGDALTGLYMALHKHGPDVRPEWRRDDELLLFEEAVEQLRAYFAGKLQVFDLPLRASGTPFQQTVWEALRGIPYSETISYGELAKRIGSPGSSRPVGLANGRNPISIVVPCHRVIGASGKLTGYGGGVERKAALLDFEREVVLFGASGRWTGTLPVPVHRP
jgi:methylated-DNA-[protein]-cysteine S-methyltransferase